MVVDNQHVLHVHLDIIRQKMLQPSVIFVQQDIDALVLVAYLRCAHQAQKLNYPDKNSVHNVSTDTTVVPTEHQHASGAQQGINARMQHRDQ